VKAENPFTDSELIREKVLDFFLFKEESPLIFTSLEFWIFLFLFLLFFSASYRQKAIKNFLILVFSLFFGFKF
jgi:hypothetical protein